MKSFMASPATIERKWYVVDAAGCTLGRLASEVAKVLRGKNKPTFTPLINRNLTGSRHQIYSCNGFFPSACSIILVCHDNFLLSVPFD